MILLPAPAALHGDALTTELAAAGLPDAGVTLVGDELHIDAPESARATVERVVAAHVPPAPPADPDEEFRKSLEAATSWQTLRDALLGKAGPGAEPRRPDGR
jgi:hypothetical protein